MFVDPFGGKGYQPPPEKDQKFAVRHDAMDESAWLQTLDQVRWLAEHVEKSAEKRETAREAYEDLFNLLSQGDPRFTDVERMVEEYLPQHAILQNLSDSDELKFLRRETKYDEYNTALAMLTLKDRLDKSLDSVQEQIDAIKAAAEALAQALAAAEEALANGTPLDQVEADLQAALDAAGIAIGEGQEGADATTAMMEKALKEARDKIKAEQDAMAGYGISPGELKRMSFPERRALAERFEPDRMKKLARLLGQFRPAQEAERRRRVTAQPEERIDVTLGNDLTRLVPSELYNFAIPELEELTWLRWVKGEMMQFDVSSVEKVGRGPILCICDESGSMGAGLDGEGNTREMWSKAVALALCDQALRDKRDFTYIGFSSHGQVWQTDFPGGKADHDKIIDFVSHFFCGGTAYEPPLQLAAKIIREYGEEGRMMPDVVFITDDSCRVGEPFIKWWRELKEQFEVTMYGLQIGGEPWANNLKDLSDRCMNIDSLNAHPEGVAEIFRQI